MNALTKIYRLVWDEDKKLSMNPYDEYSPNSVTYTNTDNYFESNEIGDIEDKINDYVYKLYGLTKEEIAITEENIRN